MINKIQLKNFKAFKELKSMPIKPITILCGANSCGKSSILQSILLFKQTLESKTFNQILLLNGRLAHFGVFENIIYENSINDSVELSLEIKIKKEDFSRLRNTSSIPLFYIMRRVLSENSFKIPQAEYLFSYSIVLQSSKESTGRGYLRSIIVGELEFKLQVLKPDGTFLPELFVKMKRNEKKYDIAYKDLLSQGVKRNDEEKRIAGSINEEVRFINLFPASIGGEAKEDSACRDLGFVFHMVSDIFEAIFSSYTYLGPIREQPCRRYIYEDEILEIGIKGENAPYIYMSEYDDLVEDHFFYNAETNSFNKIKEIKLSEAVNVWLNFMEIKELTPEPTKEIIYLNLNSNSSVRTRVNIADVGFGVSQIFPIVLEGLRMQKRNTLLLEQPEIHLHPNLQMKMADYFIALALSGKYVLCETHSDHIINRLVRRIVEGDDDMIKNMVGIYFIRPTSEGSIYEEIIIDENSGIVNWPKDFFDQTASEQERIILAGLDKRSKKRKNNTE